VNHFYRHQAHVVRHARRAAVVVGQLSDGPGDVRAVTVEIERQIVVPDEVARRHETIRTAGPELRRGGEWYEHFAERRVDRAIGGQSDRTARVVADYRRAERHAAIQHGDDHVR
jgi:hypothetical protein